MTRRRKIAIYLTLLLLGLWYFNKDKLNTDILSPIANHSFASWDSTPNTSTNLKDTIYKALEGTKGTYAVVVKNFRTKESYSYNENLEFDAASLYKLWIMTETFSQLNQGKIEKDEVLSQDINALNSEFGIDPEFAELTEGYVTLTVSQSLRQMITISHNYAALLLAEKIGLSNVQTFIEHNNFKNSKLGDPPKTTAADIAKLLEQIYHKQLINEQSSQEMIDILKEQTLNDKIPKYLPEEAKVAHKTGELGQNSHDAAIVYNPKGDYLIVVLSESNFPPGAKDRIAQISKSVYDYFSQSAN